MIDSVPPDPERSDANSKYFWKNAIINRLHASLRTYFTVGYTPQVICWTPQQLLARNPTMTGLHPSLIHCHPSTTGKS